MKALKILSVVAFMALTSCSSVRVHSDYDSKTDFSQVKSYAFFKDGIDKAEISDLDKKRLLNAIDAELSSKGMVKGEHPDILINIFTKAQQRVDIYNNNYYSPWGYYGYGWGPYWGSAHNSVSTSTEGRLFIDILDTNKKELIWQGTGTGYLTNNRAKKDARIQEFVKEVLKDFPPKK